MKTAARAETLLAALPKAELHLHLEGSVEPATVVELARRSGVTLTTKQAAARYSYRDFPGFLEAFKWVTAFLRTPADYGLVAERLVERLLKHSVVYAEVTLAVGVWLLRGQNVEANLAAVRQAGEHAVRQGLKLQWVFDAVRQYGADAAMQVARWAVILKPRGVVAFGLGGDELSLDASHFHRVYDFARGEGLHVVAHAGEIGSPQGVREAVEVLGAERIGHGIAAIRDPALMDWLAEKQIPLELCPTSNLHTGALARQLGGGEAKEEEHPLRTFFERGLCVTLSTDDPAMFRTNLTAEYAFGHRQGLSLANLARIAEMSFEAAFLPQDEKRRILEAFRQETKRLRLV